MSEVPQQLMCAAVNRCFEAEGLPRCIKIDNGLPLVYPRERDLPTLTVLWWVGLNIHVVYNKPRCPQQNGTVEGLQGTCFRWSQPLTCVDSATLQVALDEADRIQRRVYRIPKKTNATRQMLFPELDTNSRKFGLEAFDFDRVKTWLSNKVWTRVVNKSGGIKMYRAEIYISQKMAGQTVTVQYDSDEAQWVVRNSNGQLLKTSKKGIITKEMLLNHANMSKNKGPT